MQKYYLIEWPESQKWLENEEVIPSNDMSAFVPCELYDEQSQVYYGSLS